MERFLTASIQVKAFLGRLVAPITAARSKCHQLRNVAALGNVSIAILLLSLYDGALTLVPMSWSLSTIRAIVEEITEASLSTER